MAGQRSRKFNLRRLQTAHGFNAGDPIVVFNSKLGEFFAGDLVGNCGGQGVGLWTSKDGKNWKVGACAHNGGADDRESMWADNEPTSGTYGRMYVSYNDYTTNCGAGGCLFVTYSDDGNYLEHSEAIEHQHLLSQRADHRLTARRQAGWQRTARYSLPAWMKAAAEAMLPVRTSCSAQLMAAKPGLK